MTSSQRTTESQNRMAFRFAVQACLEKFYREPAAESIVSDWWDRIEKTSAFKSGLFMHSEPIDTAARLIDKTSVELSLEDDHQYEQIKSDAFRLALKRDKEVKQGSRGIFELGEGRSSGFKTRLRTAAPAKSSGLKQQRVAVAKKA